MLTSSPVSRHVQRYASIVILAVFILLTYRLVSKPTTAVADHGEHLVMPWSVGQTWYICQGYNGQITHWGQMALDVSIDPNAPGYRGCGGNPHASAHQPVFAPASGYVSAHDWGGLCINLNRGGSIFIGHMRDRAPVGTQVVQNQQIGTVAPVGEAMNNGYAHLHLQVHSGPYCGGSPMVPFDDAHDTRFVGGANLPYSGTANQHSGVALTKPDTTSDSGPPTPTYTPLPTDTPVPTNTPIPTDTPVPTNTSLPTNTPPPTNTPSEPPSSRAPVNPPALAAPTETLVPIPTPTNSPTVQPTATPVTRTPREGTVDVALIIDSSASMIRNDPQNLRRDAAKAFIAAMEDEDQVTIIGFDAGATVWQPLVEVGPNRAILNAAIDNVDSFGATNIPNALTVAYDELMRSPYINTKAAVLLTDGKGNYTDEASLYASQGWRIFTIALGSGTDEGSLAAIASETGGKSYRVSSPELLEHVYFEIATELRAILAAREQERN